ncbi:hypothetical protein [Caballeronia sp. 15711]|uniref:hypothetical protein n=1 Tax=Caballeronia sp. 15711 TaxID=3391029 RepID=UPI0039E453CD
MAEAQERLEEAERQQEVNRDEISHVYEVAKPYMTRNLFVDMLTDGDGAAFHRFQNLMWTLVLVIFYVYTTLTTFETPKLGATLLGLMGISGGVYLGFKFNEKPGQPEEKPK